MSVTVRCNINYYVKHLRFSHQKKGFKKGMTGTSPPITEASLRNKSSRLHEHHNKVYIIIHISDSYKSFFFLSFVSVHNSNKNNTLMK